MAILPNLSSVQITGTVTMGYKDQPELQKFCEYYRAKIEMTDRQAFERTAGVVQVGATPQTVFGPETVSSGRVVGVYLPESKLNELIQLHAKMIDERLEREDNPMLMDMWHKYQMMRQMYK